MDYLQCKQDKQIKQLLQPGQTIVLSTMIYKYNHVNKKQQRILLITNLAIYNIGKSNIINDFFAMLGTSIRLKRRISYQMIIGITVSRYGYQFVINVNSQHDYRYSSTDKKQIIIDTICQEYCNYHKKKMAFYFTDELILIKYCTTKIDVKQKKSKHPQQKPTYLDPSDLKTNQNAKGNSETIYARKQSLQPISIQDFYPIKVLGKGAFGKVMLCQMKGKHQLYAVKSMRKQNIIQQQQIQKAKTERRIMQQVNHPFIVSLQYSFQTKQKLFFVMKFIRGGELFQHLHLKKKFSEELTKFYTAQIIIALDYIHQKNFIYRDLKPENILVNDDGYLMLTDFGMSKYLFPTQKTMSFAGTPQYIAPQIIKSSGHNKCADWWSLGILVYEMLNGFVPFTHQNPSALFNLIVDKDLIFRQDNIISDNGKDFIRGLLNKNPDYRLGKNGIIQFKKHAWMQGVPWDLILNKKMKPPYIPKLYSEVDVSYFGRQFTEQIPEFSYMEANMTVLNKFKKDFADMDYKSKSNHK